MEFARKFKTIPHIKSYHHFRLTVDSPGSVYVKTHTDTEVQIHNYLPGPLLPHNFLHSSNLWVFPQRGSDTSMITSVEFWLEYPKHVVAHYPRLPKPGSTRSTAQPPAIVGTPPAQKRDGIRARTLALDHSHAHEIHTTLFLYNYQHTYTCNRLPFLLLNLLSSSVSAYSDVV